MAIVQTDFTPSEKYIPYTGLTALERSQSGIARAEYQYFTVNENWAASGAGDARILKTQITLPSGFGYLITDCFANLTVATTYLKTEAAAELRAQPSGVLGPNIVMQMPSKAGRQDSSGTTAIGSLGANAYNTVYPSWRGNYGSITYELTNKPTVLLYDYDDGKKNSIITWTVSEEALQEPEAQLNFFLRVLQFDVDQSYNYVINSPQLTR